MSVLAEFLEEEAKRLTAEKPAREELVREWTDAVNRLLDLLEGWIKDADKKGVVGVNRTTHRFNDEKMGRYELPGLEFDLDGQTVAVVPVARRVVASVPVPGEDKPRRADGRVDLKRHGDTFYVLYRVGTGPDDDWYVEHSGVWDTRRRQNHVVPLTREEFELDLMSLFR